MAMLIWTLTRGDVGSVNQALGLAERVAEVVEGTSKIVVKTVDLKQPWAGIPPGILRPPLSGISADSDELTPPWPDVLISCGRRAAALAMTIKRHSALATFTVHVQDPIADPKHFDLVVIPDHDRVNREIKRENVIYTMGAPNRVTPGRLEDGAAALAARIGDLPAPRVAALIGGANKRYRMPEKLAREIAARLTGLSGEDGPGLLVTTSRRTGAANDAAIRDVLDGAPAWVWDGEGENPYFGMLGLAEHIVVTADSVSMVSEAAATGKPVHVIPLEGSSERFDAFHRAMQAGGFTRPLEAGSGGALETWEYIPLDETGRIAAEIAKRLEDRAD